MGLKWIALIFGDDGGKREVALPFVGIVMHQESMKQKREIGEDRVNGKTRDEMTIDEMSMEESIAFAQRKDAQERYETLMIVTQLEDGLHIKLLSTQSKLELLGFKNIDTQET